MEGGKVVDMAKRNHAQRATLTLVACSALVVAGCGTAKPQPEGSDTPGEAAGAPGTWELLNAGDMTAESTTLQLGVTRASCAGGVTGTVLEPVVQTAAGRITITANVEPMPPGGYTCQSNNIVPVTVQLPEPVGNRELFDAICLDSSNLTTAFCVDGGIRWQP